eukprot:TRINITY_DN1276_c0_g1_i1.p1 TRINITY_DN1276_c0_g1~~TRINITY_DN1276_c0_g1_i1.p1  ORF type:complete len:230 (-),score=29.83 TRINITY_DN1276_c0_g1_i1:646-1257(-)
MSNTFESVKLILESAGLSYDTDITDADTVEDVMKKVANSFIEQKRSQVQQMKSQLKVDFESFKETAKRESKNNSFAVLSLLRLIVKAGPHSGKEYSIKLKTVNFKIFLAHLMIFQRKSDIFVGRSTGAKFTRWGISLSNDSNVAITHGKFEVVDGKLCFTDCGSTTGTMINGNPINENDAQAVKVGDEIQLGDTSILVITEIQ